MQSFRLIKGKYNLGYLQNPAIFMEKRCRDARKLALDFEKNE
jgi:hypothetical protein